VSTLTDLTLGRSCVGVFLFVCMCVFWWFWIFLVFFFFCWWQFWEFCFVVFLMEFQELEPMPLPVGHAVVGPEAATAALLRLVSEYLGYGGTSQAGCRQLPWAGGAEAGVAPGWLGLQGW